MNFLSAYIYRQSRYGWILILCFFAAVVPTLAQQNEIIKIETELVNLNVVVIDRQGQRVSGLKKEDFEVYEDGKLREITYFSPQERPLRLVLLFDISLSMEKVLPIVKEEAVSLVNNLRSDDEVSIVSFASEILTQSDWLKAEQAKSAIKSLTPESHSLPTPIGQNGYRIGDGNTNLYGAFQYVFNKFRADNDRIAVVMFSDGVDTAAGRNVDEIKKRDKNIGEEIKRQAQESWTLVYPIRYKTEQVIGEMPKPAWRPAQAIKSGSSPAEPGRELFSKIAEASGGEVFEWTTQRDLLAAIRKVLTDLRSQYGIAYTLPDTGNKTGFHRIKVRVKRPNLIVQTREGYIYNR